MTTIASSQFSAHVHLQQAMDRLADSAARLATGRRIQHTSDDPAGAVAAKDLRTDLDDLRATVDAAERLRSAVRTADTSLDHAGELIVRIRSNVTAAVDTTTSPAEREVLQLEIDAALDALDRIGATTDFSGRQLLDGSAALSLDDSAVQLPAVDSGHLGTDAGRLSDLRSGGRASLASGDYARAVDILDAAGGQISSAHIQAGAFERYAVDRAAAIAADSVPTVAGQLSSIVDTDFATEAAHFIRSEIQAKVAVAVVRLTNQRQASIAELLDGVGRSLV